MGQMRFTVPRLERITADAVARAYLAGMEYIPWRSRCRLVGGEIIAERNTDESGNFYIPWRIEGHGELVLSTASLMEREAAYHLPVELARGTLNRIRNQLAAWRSLGFKLPEPANGKIQSATDAFIRAAVSQQIPEFAADEAEKALIDAMDAVDSMTAAFAAQVLASRHRDAAKLPTVLAANIGSQPLNDPVGKLVRTAFNGVVIPFCWRDIESEEGQFEWDALDQQIEWCQGVGLKIWTGPLLSFDAAHVPDWLYLYEGDYENIRSYVLSFVSAATERYAGKVQVWQCAGGMNVEGAVTLSEESKLRLTVDVVQAVRCRDAGTPMIVSFDQPWAELLSRQDLDLSPIHFADALVRAELGVAGLGLELNLGYWPGGSPRRDLLELNRLIDYWSGLGLPLLLLLTMPSNAGEDGQARRRLLPQPQSFPDAKLTPVTQAKVAGPLLEFLVCKQAVYGVAWNQLSDRLPHPFAHGGLLDANDQAKPILEIFNRIRREHLG